MSDKAVIIICVTILILFCIIAYICYAYISFLNHNDTRDFIREDERKVDEKFKKLPREVRRKAVRTSIKKVESRHVKREA